MNVLVVDDNSICRKVICRTLENGGYNVMSANDGRAALELFHQHSFQIVVTDWLMPYMSGIELCQAMRRASGGRYVYCIIVSSLKQSADLVRGFEEGADDYLTKPFNPHELLLRVGIGRRTLNLKPANLTIFALAKLAETRDPETGSHLERVQCYCRVLAEYLTKHPRFAVEADHNFVDLIYRTSPLHDIGKVAIPDDILLKPGRLTEEEFEIMKSHTTYGADAIQSMLRNFPGLPFLKMALDIILTHHEKWDGSGYPKGLKAEQIPLCGRIMAVADVYDALTSKRVYKDAFSHERAKSIILEGAGTHFDPEMVQAFINTEQEFISIASGIETAADDSSDRGSLLHQAKVGCVVA